MGHFRHFGTINFINKERFLKALEVKCTFLLPVLMPQKRSATGIYTIKRASGWL